MAELREGDELEVDPLDDFFGQVIQSDLFIPWLEVT